MKKSENTNIVETHGCIICGKMYNVLVVYTPERRLVDCAVTSPGGHRVPDEQRPLVACDTHTAKKIEAAYTKWNAEMGEVLEKDQEAE